uniref:Putative RNA-directed DNA polymerase from transposon BS n=1 Tax=Lygus hesperus TaxID=30085 RepID=A0A0A9VYL8_LYGHE
MTVNASKCKAMFVGYPRLISGISNTDLPSITIGDHNIEYEGEVKSLGIILSKTLSWGPQVTRTCNKIYSSLYQLRRLAIDFPFGARLQLVQSLVMHHFDYALTAQCDMTDEQLHWLQKAQNAVLRFVFRLRMDEHVTPFRKRLGWLNMKQRKEFAVALLMFKVLKFKTPPYLADQVAFLDAVHGHQTRQRLIQVPQHRTTIYNKSFNAYAIRLYNAHAELFDIGQSVQSFKNNYKKFLMTQVQ